MVLDELYFCVCCRRSVSSAKITYSTSLCVCCEPLCLFSVCDIDMVTVERHVHFESMDLNCRTALTKALEVFFFNLTILPVSPHSVSKYMHSNPSVTRRRRRKKEKKSNIQVDEIVSPWQRFSYLTTYRTDESQCSGVTTESVLFHTVEFFSFDLPAWRSPL